MPLRQALSAAASLFLIANASADPAVIEVETEDGVTIYGEPYFAALGKDAPLVMLFHQARSSGRGEYAGIAQWLNQNGFRAIAWDQRSGGDLFGGENRTLAGLPEGATYGYCDVYPDLAAALDHVVAAGIADKAVVWGSSYSASLVFRLAKERPDAVIGVAGFSPAAGGPMEPCRARLWAGEITAPMLALRPETEMAYDSSIEQREILTGAGVEFMVIENGVHGSSMLVDSRTEQDMSAARASVLAWLKRVTAKD